MSEVVTKGSRYKIYYPNKDVKHKYEGIATASMPLSRNKKDRFEFWNVRFEHDQSNITYDRLVDPSDRVRE